MGLRNSRRLVSLLLWAAVALAAGASLLALAPAASATGNTIAGVYCMDVYLDASPLSAKGQPPGPEDSRATKIMTRVDLVTTTTFNITQVAYTGPDEDNNLVPDKPPSANPCTLETDGHTLNSSVTQQTLDLDSRPTATGTLVTKGSQQNLEWSVCQFEEDLLDGTWVLSQFAVVMDGKSGTVDYGLLTADLDSSACNPNSGLEFQLVIASKQRVVSQGVVTAGADDWDGDGCSDWRELAVEPPGGGDPFFSDCLSVGGVSELADAPLAGGSSARVLALSLGALLITAAMGGGVWAARRRRMMA